MKNLRSCQAIFCSECQLSKICLSSVLPPKKIIYSPKDRLKNLYILQSGSVKSYTLSENGDEHITDFHFPGDFIGLEALHSGVYTSFAAALQASTLCVVPVEKLLQLSSEMPAVLYQLIKLLSTKLELHMGMKTHHRAEEKVAVFLAQLANRFEQSETTGYTLSMSRQDIGNHLGLAPETVSRIFSHFQKTGIVNLDHRHVQLNREKLDSTFDVDV